MKGKKNLERAIILGLILSASVYGITYAEEISINDFRNSSDSFGNINVDKNTVVIGTGEPAESANSIANKTITVSKEVILKLENLTGHSPYIIGNGDIYITKTENFTGAGIYVNGNITANSLTIENPIVDGNNGKGIYTYGGDVNINVNKLTIKSYGHGIFTTPDAQSNVNILDAKIVNIETDGAHGIVNSGNASHVNNIIIKSDRKNSSVYIFSHTAGISNNNSGGGVIDIKADTISISTDNLYAVRGDHGDIILNAKNNTISGGTSGVHTLNGDIKITAEKGNQIATTNNKDVTLGAIYTSTDEEGNPGNGTIEIIAKNGNNKVNAVTDGVHTKGNGTVDLIANGYNSIISDKNAVYNNGTNTINIKAVASENETLSTLADYNDYDNVLIAGENGVKSDSTGTTNVIADNNNYIAGTTNGILSNGAGIIKVDAGNSNYIGKVTYTGADENGNEETYTITSKTGINVIEGIVDVKATNGDNNIYANDNGIIIVDVNNTDGNNSKVVLEGKNNNIKVDSKSMLGSGISMSNSEIVINSKDGDFILDVDTSFTKSLANLDFYGFNVDNSKINLDATGDVVISLDAEANVNAGSDRHSGGLIINNNSDAEIEAGNIIYIESNVNKTPAVAFTHNDNYGLKADKKSSITIKSSGKTDKGYGAVVTAEGTNSKGIFSEGSLVDIDTIGGGIYVKNTAQDESYSLYNLAGASQSDDPDFKPVSDFNSTIDINAKGDVYLGSFNNSPSESYDTIGQGGNVGAIYNESHGSNTATLNIIADDVVIESIAKGSNRILNAYGIKASGTGTGESLVNIDADNLSITAKIDGARGNSFGIDSRNANVDIDVTGSTYIESSQYGIYAQNYYTKNNTETNIDINSCIDNNIYGKTTGIMATGEKAVTNLTAGKGINLVQSVDGTAIRSENNAKTVLKAENAYNNVISDNSTGIYSAGTSDVENNTKVELIAKGNNVSGSTGIWGLNNGKVSLDASTLTNEITADSYGIYANTKSDIDLNAGNSNNILSAKITITDEDTGVTADYGQQSAVYALNGSNVDLAAGEQNYLLGAVYANGTGTNVNVKGKDGSTATNVIRSHAAIANAGDIDTTTEGSEFKGKTFYSALYAEDGANIKLDGNNIIGTWADSGKDAMLERTVWAYNEGTIDITGATQIRTDRYDSSPNSADVAIAAGTATKLTKDIVDNYDETDNPRATVTVNYDDFKDENGVSISKSNISGDILSAYAGLVDISTDNSEAGINIYGNLLAGNNGILSVDLGKGGTLIGRADDYGDAGYVGNIENEGDSNEHQNFYNPAFSSTIYSGGRVDLEMGAGSTWYVTGQSWITSINTENAQGYTKDNRATIDLTTLYQNHEDDNTTAHALTVYDFKGSADIKMNLSGDRANSDMLYMKHADGTYRINLANAVTTDEINSDHDGNSFSGLRFATVGSDSNVNFVVGSYDNGGAFNVEYEVGTDEYGGTETAHENDVYNGGSLNSGKPGSDMVDGFFGNNDGPVSDNNGQCEVSAMDLQAENAIMLLDEEGETLDETVTAEEPVDYNATNHKIIARLGDEISDTGKTILNMSRANYSNAIYMDRLNKRLGEARYINSEEDEGMWVRIRHDRIGKDDAYRSQNTMYELGYDQKQECDNGERRVGMAIDYMHGDTGYDQIAGKGEIDRYGLWLYDTWMGDKGHYADYVAKWGHLSNDFEVYTMQNGDKVTGDYSNNVFSVSAEYGRKKDIGNDWYFEPQVQAQLARVTGADYTTNQGTKVSVDGINSLIGRAGFRLGKDFGEEKQSTVYIKADVLHEFLGDQDVRVLDKSSDNKWAGISYENEGTWYDVGFGFATQMSKNSYAFMDFEKSFGNDNDETYQINVGMQWSF